MVSVMLGLALLTTVQASFGQAFRSAWPNTDFELSDIDLSEIMSGGPPRDGIPPIDKPVFVSVDEAGDWIAAREPVIVVAIEDQVRAYPLQIMTWHEIVNDSVADIPIAVTFCPLCNASIVFDRRVGDAVLDFGTTGLLRKSDLVMYDRQTDSWWQQFTGKSIVGDYLGQELDRIPSSIIAFETYAESYPAGLVLSRQTGANRPYGNNPYAGYDDIDSSPFLFRGKTDDRLPPMERVLGVRVGGKYKVYPFSMLENKRLVEDRIGEMELLVVSANHVYSVLDDTAIAESRLVPQVTAWQRKINPEGAVMRFRLDDGALVDLETGSSWNALGESIAGPLKGSRLLPLDSGIHFAFAWLAFNPETEIYQTTR